MRHVTTLTIAMLSLGADRLLKDSERNMLMRIRLVDHVAMCGGCTRR